MRDRFPSVAGSDLASTDAFRAAYELQNKSNTLLADGNPYPNFLPDYHPRPYAGFQRYFRYTLGAQIEQESPSELQVLKIGLQNPLGNVYTATPTGKQVPITFFVPQPVATRYREGPVGNVQPEAPEINQGGYKAYNDIVSSIVRRR